MDKRKKGKKQLTEDERQEYWREKRKLAKERKKLRKLEANKETVVNANAATPASAVVASKDVAEASGDLIIDLDWESEMNDRDIRSLAVQLGHLYGVNRRSSKPFRLHFCGLGPKLRTALEKVGAANWTNVYLDSTLLADTLAQQQKEHETAPPKSRLVYLTADTDTLVQGPLTSDDDVYVIGGLVDHNRLKGACLARAQSMGVRTAALPFAEHLAGNQRRVISVNQVGELLIRVRQSNGDWLTSLQKTLPARRQFTSKPTAKQEPNESKGQLGQ